MVRLESCSISSQGSSSLDEYQCAVETIVVGRADFSGDDHLLKSLETNSSHKHLSARTRSRPKVLPRRSTRERTVERNVAFRLNA